MKGSLLFLFSILIGSLLTHASEPLSPSLSKETTRALLENMSGLPPPIGGPIPEDEYLELRKPLTVTLLGGRRFSGTLSNMEDQRIYLRIVQEGGEVVLSFPFEEVQEIYFPGREIVERTIEMIQAGQLSEALPYLESIIGTRYPLFPLIPPEKLSFFRALPLSALSVDNPAQAIAYTKAIRPYLTLPEDQDELDDIELLAYYQLRLTEEAETRARSWIDRTSRFDQSALGFFILSALQFENGDIEQALYTALNPIVFSGANPTAYLDQCYAIAIASAHLLDDPIERDKLLDELWTRDLQWKPLQAFLSAAKGLEDLEIKNPEGFLQPVLIEKDKSEDLLNSKSTDSEPSPNPVELAPL
ncbi:hypothetical protein [Puniceicoccus vermicola]|uniref:Tetratricopeptide repeat protein n=1 Tax=Puniceicoccus vermicola TaxID=388746 RepID=A0A7X1E392_9BACT|nr:hypothetical protein [Puniceicoccus vermicola]MBC2600724.1 hypothetical protein [Puniceicoccus vermicola]